MRPGKFLFFLLFLAGCTITGADKQVPLVEPPITGVKGLFFLPDGQPASDTWIYAYASQQGNFRGPADFAARGEADGRYLLDLPPGEWYLVARKRKDSSTSGPPKTGDIWAIYSANPLIVHQGTLQQINFRLQKAGQHMLLRGDSVSSGDTGFRGRLVDTNGQPLTGAFALVYRNNDFRRMPDYTSAAVGADGKFVIYVPDAGRYCLAARQRNRGQPIQGEPYGLLDKGKTGCRTIDKGTILNVGKIHLTPYLR